MLARQRVKLGTLSLEAAITCMVSKLIILEILLMCMQFIKPELVSYGMHLFQM